MTVGLSDSEVQISVQIDAAVPPPEPLAASAEFEPWRPWREKAALFAAEDRDLLHPPGTAADLRAAYARGYGVGRLRERAMRRASWDFPAPVGPVKSTGAVEAKATCSMCSMS